MPKYHYTIKGTPYRSFDMKAEIEALLSLLQLPVKVHVRTLKNRFVLEMEGEKEIFSILEPELLRTVTKLIDIEFYNKKAYDEAEKKYLQEKLSSKNSTFQNMLKKSIPLLARGEVIAVKTVNGYHLLCNATKTKAVNRLREIADQPTQPLPVLFKNMINLEKLVLVSKQEKELLSSEERPFVIAKKKLLHRLERERYRHVLSPQINPLNQRITVAIDSKEPFYQELFEEISFPVISLEATTDDGVLITDISQLSDRYADKIKFVLDTDVEILTPQPRAIYQFIYGKACRIIPPQEVKAPDDALTILLDTKDTKIGSYTIEPIKVLHDENRAMQPALTAMSLLFHTLPIKKVRELKLPFSAADIEENYKRWQQEENTTYTRTVLLYFDAVVGLCAETERKSFDMESMLRCEGAFEVCEEALFDYNIEDEKISIDILSTFLNNQKFKSLASTLCNSVSEIILDSVTKHQAKKVALTGDNFTCRDLTELTIEKLRDRQIEVFY
jgi:hydrogenase maturation factor HypF (carbamoyltransferase family)